MAGLAQAGAAMGSVIAPGVGTAVGGLAGALADTFMGSGSSGSSSGGYTSQGAESAIYGGTGMDSSGWNVNFSGVQSAGANKATPSVLESLAGSTGGGVSPLLLVGGLVLLVLLWKKSKSS